MKRLDLTKECDLAAIIDAMPDRTRSVMSMHIDNKTMIEIGTELGVSECRISQIQSRVCAKLEILSLATNPEIIAQVVKW